MRNGERHSIQKSLVMPTTALIGTARNISPALQRICGDAVPIGQPTHARFSFLLMKSTACTPFEAQTKRRCIACTHSSSLCWVGWSLANSWSYVCQQQATSAALPLRDQLHPPFVKEGKKFVFQHLLQSSPLTFIYIPTPLLLVKKP